LVGTLTLDAGFVFDDASALTESPIVNGAAPCWEAFVRDFWGRPIGGGVNSWRPLMPIIWALLWKFFPDDPLPFHALSLLLHVVATGLATRLAYVLRGSEAWAVTVGVLFAVHPLNSEALGAIVAQADLFSFSLVLVACLIAVKSASSTRGLACGASLLAASLFKESAIILGPLPVLLIAMQDAPPRRRWIAALPSALVALAVIGFQLALPRRATTTLWGNTLAHEVEGVQRLVLGLYTVGRSIVMSFWPHGLAPSHGYAALELNSQALWPFAAAGTVLLLVGLGSGCWALRECRNDWVVPLSFLYAPALLQSHWFIRLITDLAERLLYPATLGAAMIAAAAIFRWLPGMRARRLSLSGIVLSALLLAVPTRRAWVSNDALWENAVRVEPKAMRHQYNLSNARIRQGRLDEAAFHRLVTVYLVNRFPEPVEWNKVEALESLPVPERFVELPSALYPDSPCNVIVAFLKQNEELHALHAHVLARWVERYPQCFRATPAP